MILSGPLGVYTPAQAQHVELMFEQAAQKARLAGLVLFDDVTDFMADVRRLAAHYRRSTTDAADANVSTVADVSPIRTMLTTGMTSDLAGISRHAVADHARRGRLIGQVVGGQWAFDETDVLEWLAKRRAEEGIDNGDDG